MKVNEKEQRFEQMKTIFQMSGLEIDAAMKELIQPYIDGIETADTTIERLQGLLMEAK